MDLAFDDALSEDWISQPRQSSTPSAPANGSSARNSSSSPKKDRTSFKKSPSSGDIFIGKHSGALKEKTASDVNVLRGSQRDGQVGVASSGRNPASEAEDSAIIGTVNVKEKSPEKKTSNATPEWRRRLKSDGKDGGLQKDLFSPIGLERVFRRPQELAAKHQSALAHRKRTALAALEPPPSSPPQLTPVVMKVDHGNGAMGSSRREVVQRPAARNSGRFPIVLEQREPTAKTHRPPTLNPSGESRSSNSQDLKEKMDSSRTANTDSNTRSEDQSCQLQGKSLQDSDEKMGVLDMEHVPRPSSRASDSGLDYRKIDSSQRKKPNVPGSLRSRQNSHSLMAADLATRSGFVTLRRGGFSPDGSFLNQPLSPSSFQPLVTSEREEMPSIVSDGKPIALDLSQGPVIEDKASSERTRSSGSPLKIFDSHDSFTNERLTRRISQFVDDANNVEETLDTQDFTEEVPTNGQQHERAEAKQRQRRVTSFGFGELDKFTFNHPTPRREESSALYDSALNEESQISLPAMPPRIHSHSQKNGLRKVSKKPTPGYRNTTPSGEPGKHHSKEPTPPHLHDGKRQLRSPQKSPNAKRQRTLNESSIQDLQNLERGQIQNLLTPPIAGKKRKDAKYGTLNQAADANVLASRHLLRPRTHQISQKRGPSEIKRDFQSRLEPDNDEDALSNIDATTEVIADNLVHTALDVAKGITEGARKRSVTTADFFKEANAIMQHIRARAQAQDFGAGTENARPISSPVGPVYEESTAESFSRPSSREGRVRQDRKPRPSDPRIVSHLRRFEEVGEPTMAFESSSPVLQASGRQNEQILRVNKINVGRPRGAEEEEHEEASLDDPNVDDAALEQQKNLSQRSNGSRGTSSTESAPTGISTGSRTKANIPPEKVSHLIGETIGHMTFDHARQCWIKRKLSKSKISNGVCHHVGSEGTEDDPLQEIPDLAVDESQELRRVGRYTTYAMAQQINGSDDHATEKHIPDVPRLSTLNESPGPSDPIRDPEPLLKGVDFKPTSRDLDKAEDHEPALHEQKIVEDSQETLPTPVTNHKLQSRLRSQASGRHQSRKLTVGFSSPLIGNTLNSKLQRSEHHVESEEEAKQFGDEIQRKHAGKESKSARPMINPESSIKNSFGESGNNLGSRGVLSEPEPCTDISIIPNRQGQDWELLAPTPLLQKSTNGALLPASATSAYVSLQLSPLPEFTINQPDESLSLDVNYVAKRKSLKSLPEIEGRFSLALQDLVEKITNVEPYEPYWEYLRYLDLRGAGLLTLHMLERFCYRVETLNVSQNQLGQLNGVPRHVRSLEVQKNCLTSLTAWGHLQNLQYLNISGNEIQSLRSVGALVHLRELVADGNQIENLEGVLRLDGLIKLSVKENSIRSLDLLNAELPRLVELEVDKNAIAVVTGLERIAALQKLSLRHNELEVIDLDSDPTLERLETLDISWNKLQHLDVSYLPRLRNLRLDRNSVSSVRGLNELRDISQFSLRGQRFHANSGRREVEVASCEEARELALSHNRIAEFPHGLAFFNLLRLELVSCGLEALSSDFGLFVPNLRFLNLNNNAIQDLNPIMGIEKLEELHLAGNRIGRLRQTSNVLATFAKTLTILDCRANPLTAGFYPLTMASSEEEIVDASPSPWKGGTSFEWLSYDTTELREALYTPLDEDVDQEHRATLGPETNLRRRVYELLLLRTCRRLDWLDGMRVNDVRILKRDDPWQRLVDLKVVSERDIRESIE